MKSAGSLNGRSCVLRVEGASKAFDGNQALDNVSFELRRGTIHALLGGNGSGKSTLIKLIAGVEAADAGDLEINGERLELRMLTPAFAREAGLHFVHQQQSTFPELTVAENLAIGRGFDTGVGGRVEWRRTRRRAARVLHRFRIDAHPDQALGELGPATQTMVAIARGLQDQDDADEGVLLLDEPTASLPAPEVDLLLGALRTYAEAGQSIVYVTHRLEEVFAVADEATLLRDGKRIDTVEPRVLTHDVLVELMMGRTVEKIERIRTESEGPVVLEAKKLDTGPLHGVDISVRRGEIVGIAGLLGSGRSTLLKVLFGLVALDAGTIELDGKPLQGHTPNDAMAAGIAYVPEDRAKDAAFPELTVKENLSVTVIPSYWHGGVLNQRREARDSRGLFKLFMITAESERSPLRSLSGGNQQKVILARWLRRQPRILLLDEPTQGVDVAARAEIYELVHRAVADGAAALVASSDLEELAAVCDRVVVLRKGALVGEVAGSELDADRLTHLANAEVTVA